MDWMLILKVLGVIVVVSELVVMYSTGRVLWVIWKKSKDAG